MIYCTVCNTECQDNSAYCHEHKDKTLDVPIHNATCMVTLCEKHTSDGASFCHLHEYLADPSQENKNNTNTVCLICGRSLRGANRNWLYCHKHQINPPKVKKVCFHPGCETTPRNPNHLYCSVHDKTKQSRKNARNYENKTKPFLKGLGEGEYKVDAVLY